ncbi:hypothetical protein FB106_102218 [Synechococcus sp. Ace-Pa]|nr:hypothetical protein FB106_102218 [Synechococcus sp. Ace-Pa]
MIHTLCDVFDFVYYLFHDQSPEKKIQKSIDREIEAGILKGTSKNTGLPWKHRLRLMSSLASALANGRGKANFSWCT